LKLSTARLFPLLLMLSLAALTFWLERTVREEEGRAPLAAAARSGLHHRQPEIHALQRAGRGRFHARGGENVTLSGR
jgi:hypothetical protein